MKYIQAKKDEMPKNDGWCFAIINHRLGEIYFKKGKGIHGHCYIDRKTFNKREQRMIDVDIKRFHFTYRNKFYFDRKRGIKHRATTIL